MNVYQSLSDSGNSGDSETSPSEIYIANLTIDKTRWEKITFTVSERNVHIPLSQIIMKKILMKDIL